MAGAASTTRMAAVAGVSSDAGMAGATIAALTALPAVSGVTGVAGSSCGTVIFGTTSAGCSNGRFGMCVRCAKYGKRGKYGRHVKHIMNYTISPTHRRARATLVCVHGGRPQSTRHMV